MPCMAVAGGQVGGAGSLASIHILALGKLCSRVSQVLEQRTQSVSGAAQLVEKESHAPRPSVF